MIFLKFLKKIQAKKLYNNMWLKNYTNVTENNDGK